MINENNILLKEYKDSKEWGDDLQEYIHSVFHCQEWINSVCEGGSVSPVFLDFFINNEKVGKISGVIVSNRITGKSLYFYSGPAIKEENYNLYLSLTNTLLSYTKDNKYSRLIVGSYGANYSPEIISKSFYSFSRKEYTVRLDPGYRSNYSRNFRRKIKKAEKLSPSASISKIDTKTIESFLKSTLLYRTEHKKSEYNPLALPNLNYKAIGSLLKSKLAKTHSLTINKNTVGFLLTLESQTEVSALLTGIDNKFYQHGVSAYLYNYVFETLFNNGFKQINLGGIPEGAEGYLLAQFKKSMGAEEITVYGATTNYITYPYKLLNPALRIGRMLPKDNAMVKFLKKFV